ncbi:hypothetical protein DIJ63_22680, partial [Burkholderia pseudomallei]
MSSWGGPLEQGGRSAAGCGFGVVKGAGGKGGAAGTRGLMRERVWGKDSVAGRRVCAVVGTRREEIGVSDDWG